MNTPIHGREDGAGRKAGAVREPQTARSTPEWVADHPDQAIPTRVKMRIWNRCGGKCAITGKKLRPGDEYDFDHIVPLILGGKHAEGNLQVVSRQAHREKTKDDVKAKAKADRLHAKFHGYFPKSKTPLRSRGFPKTRPDYGRDG